MSYQNWKSIFSLCFLKAEKLGICITYPNVATLEADTIIDIYSNDKKIYSIYMENLSGFMEGFEVCMELHEIG
ncbi:MAG: hypothetical protein EHM12_10195 [Dehalococcoidia bacterium]|nr:MAG: hypothetical protein EHM12_10195 [Dehalococcoidia bacterium]